MGRRGTEAAPPGAAPGDAGRHGRDRVFEPARVAFDGASLACALLERSRGGARVCLYAPAAVPAVATLLLRSGEACAVRRQWQQGAQVGFLVVATAPPLPDGPGGRPQDASGAHPGSSFTGCPGAASTARSTTGAPPGGKCVTEPMVNRAAVANPAPNRRTT